MKSTTKKQFPAKTQKPVQTNSNKEQEQIQNNTHKVDDSAKAASSLAQSSSFNKKIIYGLVILIVLSIVSWGGIYFINSDYTFSAINANKADANKPDLAPIINYLLY